MTRVGHWAKGARAGHRVFPVLVLCALLAALPMTGARALDPAFLNCGAGASDMNGGGTSATLWVEYTHDQRLFWEVKPMGGLMATLGGAFYVYGGLAVDIF